MSSVIPQEVIEEVRSRADIVEVIGSYLQLKRAGANYKTICPFHKEKSPSFNVHPGKQIFHCFGCGEGGNVFTFVMKQEGMTFPESVRSLAERYGVTIPRSEGQLKPSWNEKLYEAMEAATVYYEKRLKDSGEGSPVDKYLKSRGIDPEVAAKFRLGWAPNEWEALATDLGRKGRFDPEILDKAGLVTMGKRGSYIDRFRSRLLFPLRDYSGRVIAFGGRIVGDESRGAKYINSPETPIYHKSSALYGLYEAKEPARKKGSVIIVEGYIDLISMYKAGFTNVVAASGTAFTQRHASAIKRICPEAIFLFDGDEAGIKAVQRSGPALIDYGVKTRVAVLPDSCDPDDYLKKNSRGDLGEMLSEADSFSRFLIDNILNKHDLMSVEGKISAVREVLPIVVGLSDEVERSHYGRYLSARTGTDINVIHRELSRLGRGERPSGRATGSKERKPNSDNGERILLAVFFAHPEYISTVGSEITVSDFSEGVNQSLFTLIKEESARGVLAPADLINVTEDDGLRRELSSLLVDKSLFDADESEKAASQIVNRLKYGKAMRRTLLERMITAEKSDDKEEYEEAKKKYLEYRQKGI